MAPTLDGIGGEPVHIVVVAELLEDRQASVDLSGIVKQQASLRASPTQLRHRTDALPDLDRLRHLTGIAVAEGEGAAYLGFEQRDAIALSAVKAVLDDV